MDRRSALVLLAVFSAGVFLAGLELMITAVALPSILADLVDSRGTTAWLELRKASWSVNGYLLVYILAMPLAGRLADLWGARRLFLGALAVFTVGSALAGAAQDLDQMAVAIARHVGDDDEAHAGIARQRRQQRRDGLQPPSRSADADDQPGRGCRHTGPLARPALLHTRRALVMPAPAVDVYK